MLNFGCKDIDGMEIPIAVQTHIVEMVDENNDDGLLSKYNFPKKFHNSFVTFKNTEVTDEYKQFLKNIYFDYPAMAAMVFIYFNSVITRYSIPTVFTQGPIFIVAFYSWFLSINIWNIFTFAHVTRYMMRDQNDIVKYCDNVLQNWFFGHLEDWMAVSGCIHAGMYLVARVIAGQCSHGTSLCKYSVCCRKPWQFTFVLTVNH